jgi:hypothetical protein
MSGVCLLVISENDGKWWPWAEAANRTAITYRILLHPESVELLTTLLAGHPASRTMQMRTGMLGKENTACKPSRSRSLEP